MIENKGLAHMSIPVSDLKRSIKFYQDVVGCTLLIADDRHAFMDAGGTCVILCRERTPINKDGNLDFVHHAFAVSPEQYKTVDKHLAEHGVEVLYSEDREGGTVNGPRTYFRDPDGTRLEFIHLTSYDPKPRKKS
jgi:catechol 2,3-dioxygenase-like lactoylglutathione lyase family enzyme